MKTRNYTHKYLSSVTEYNYMLEWKEYVHVVQNLLSLIDYLVNVIIHNMNVFLELRAFNYLYKIDLQ